MDSYRQEFSKEENKMADFMKALAHPARIAIMIKLAQQNNCIEGEIIQGIPLKDSSVARHLNALETAGLIKGTTNVNRSCYCINWDAFWEFSDQFGATFNDFFQRALAQDCKRTEKRKFTLTPLLVPMIQLLLSVDMA